MTLWMTIPSNPAYEVSDNSQVRNKKTGYILSVKPHVRDGYLHVKLWRNGKIDGRSVHRLVCEAFHGMQKKKNMHVAHRDGVKTNNSPENLRWATRKQNEYDKKAHLRDNAGERNGMSKISNADVSHIRDYVSRLPRSSGGFRIKKGAIDDLAENYGVTKSCIRNIISRRRK